MRAWLENLHAVSSNRRSHRLDAAGPETPSASQADADWLLQHYDFARARTLLDRILPGSKRGIYIVSSLQPVSESKPPYLVQDLSACHSTRWPLPAWVEAFVNEAAQERVWNPAEEAALVDQLRATVLSLTKDSPSIKLPLPGVKWIALL